MAERTKPLGRGLASLFAENNAEKGSSRVVLRLSEIQPRPNQPRKNFDPATLSQLADSIAANGLLQPIIVRPSAGGFYEIIAGERRWRASKMAGLSEVPVVITDSNDQAAAEIALIENIQREDLNPVEEAMGYRSLTEDYSLTQENLAARVGKSRSAIANAMRLLDLPDNVLKLISDRTISAGHARALLGLKDRSLLDELVGIIVKKELSVRQCESMVARANKTSLSEKEPVQKDRFGVDYTRELEKKLRTALGRRVRIRQGGKTNRIELEYTDENDLEGLLVKLCGKNIFKD